MNVDIRDYINKDQKNSALWAKINEMFQYVVDNFNTDLEDTKLKYSGPDTVSEEVIKQILIEQGFDYIKNVMDTLDNFTFNRLVSYLDLINQLKGHRDGLELVLKLLGFDSIIREWWEDPENEGEPWTYEIIVLFNTSYVPDVFETLERIKVFSRNYVIAKITNIEVRFLFSNFAEKGAIMAGFTKARYFGRIRERAY
jgi:hypothetical protein